MIIIEIKLKYSLSETALCKIKIMSAMSDSDFVKQIHSCLTGQHWRFGDKYPQRCMSLSSPVCLSENTADDGNMIEAGVMSYHTIHCIKTQHCVVCHPILSNLSYYIRLLYISSYPPFCHSVNSCSVSFFSWCCSRIRGAGVLSGLRTGRITWAFAAARLSQWLAHSGWPFGSSIAQPVWAQTRDEKAKKSEREGRWEAYYFPNPGLHKTMD